MNFSNKKTLLLPILFTLFTLCLVSCKGNDELTTYKAEMESLTNSIQTLQTNIDSIDVNADNSTELALTYLDEMNVTFQQMASLSVPDEFVAVESLAIESAEYMSAAVSAYHTLFTTTPYDEYSATLAEENYARAMKRQYYIGEILQGKIPKGDDIVVVTDDKEDENTNDTQEDDSTDNTEEVPTVDLLDE